ncbi:MAG TPA: YdeI/OmpD-associated family protein [Actinomycetota bacterium]|nr:YdeI/OmpD-associated family protein [Actinomycetota bacterium]
MSSEDRPRFFRSGSELRAWLEKNHAKAKELWVGYHKKGSPTKGIAYADAVDEALCFGWIDGKVKTIDELTYMQRFSPRTAKSPWSKANIKRVGELKREGRMAAAGVEAFERRDRRPAGYSYEEAERGFSGAYLEAFRSNREAWGFFQAQPPGYRKNATFWVMSAKRQETRDRRLTKLIEDSENGRRLAMLA